MSTDVAKIMDVLPPPAPAVSRTVGQLSRSVRWKQYWNIVIELAIVDFRKKYHDSSIGYAWSMLNPLLRFGVYHFVFSYLFVSKLHKFTLYLLTGVFFYNFFQDATGSAISAIKNRARLTKTIYFPRYLLVFASTTTAAISFAINTALIVVVTIIFDHASWLQLLSIIPFACLILLSAGLSLMLSILFVHFRDISEIWGVIITLGFWFTPIMYDPHYVPAPLASVALLNPVGRILVMLRSWLLYDNFPPASFVFSTIGASIAVFAFGLWLFKRYEHRVPEYV